MTYLIVPDLVGYGGANQILGWDVFRQFFTAYRLTHPTNNFSEMKSLISPGT
jgi:hypothetical protein